MRLPHLPFERMSETEWEFEEYVANHPLERFNSRLRLFVEDLGDLVVEHMPWLLARPTPYVLGVLAILAIIAGILTGYSHPAGL